MLSRKPINVQVTLRGKKYDIDGVTTVQELQSKLENESGISSSKQGRVLFGGRKLNPLDVLEDAGVLDGSVLNLVPSRKATTSTVSVSERKSSPNISNQISDIDVPMMKSGPNTNGISDLLKNAGLDPRKLDELLKASGQSGMPNLQESLDMMQNMMNSPLFQEYMNDPERLEQSRQLILNDPMLRSMMTSMPGFTEILNDPIKWREAMTGAAKVYKEMGSDIMSALAGADGLGKNGSGFGLGNNDHATFGLGDSTSALDELSEGDE